VIVKYSICIINKNSVDTIRTALNSVLKQITEEFQVVVVDESSDGSELILRELQDAYPSQMKLIFLDPKDRRGIGFARNVSVQSADGEYCIMHIDCDDEWGPHIKDFAKVFLAIESSIGPNFLLAGHQINMGRRDYLSSVGPYQSVEHGEDRDLWMRLAKRNEYVPIDHVAFFRRLPLPTTRNFSKAMKRVVWGVRDEVRKGSRAWSFLQDAFSPKGSLSWKIRLARLMTYPYARWSAKRFESFSASDYFDDVSEWNNYKARNFGLYREIAVLRGFSPDLSFLASPLSRAIFERRRNETSYAFLKSEIENSRNLS
jgi:glycosyltransferase involved in cell wall biosynthesis